MMCAGSQRVAEKLAADTRGKVYLEDAGFDWKILGPDVQDVEYVAWQCDQDAYACSGQKCSAQSIMFMHEAWGASEMLQRFGDRARSRSMDDLTVGPVITVTTARMLEHVDNLLKIPGALQPLPLDRLAGPCGHAACVMSCVHAFHIRCRQRVCALLSLRRGAVLWACVC